MYSMLQHAHSGLRWLVLVGLVLAIAFALTKWLAKKPFWTTHKKFALFGLIFTHLQVVLGLILYFISPKVVFAGESMGNTVSRFYLVEHMVGMLLAAILITIGYSRAKRATPEASAKIIFWTYTIGLLIILGSIPWPGGRIPGVGWF